MNATLKRQRNEPELGDAEALCCPLRKIRRRYSSLQSDYVYGEVDASATSEAFRKFLINTVPTNFISPDIREFLQTEANLRLRFARASGVDLAELVIGDDCLPTWPGMYWDPEEESLHSAIQSRLVDYQVSQDLGDLVRMEIINKGNLKLAEAQELGIALADVFFGDGLLPAWAKPHHLTELLAGEDNQGVSSSTMNSPYAVSSLIESHNTSATSLSNIVGDFSDETATVRLSQTETLSNLSSTATESSDHFDDEIEMNNFVSDRPVYSDAEDNIIHGADIVGGPGAFLDVDVEVYLAEEDDEVMDLPEVELAIDRDAYEHYFSIDDAVDVEIPDVYVTSYIGEDGQEDKLERDAQEETLGDVLTAHNDEVSPGINDEEEQEQEEEVALELLTPETYIADSSDASEEQTDDEDGLSW